jgi:hypothetical protein
MRRTHRVLAGIAILVAVPLAALVIAFAAKVTIDASRWQDAIAQKATDALGRPVAMQGVVRLTLGRELVLRIGELRVLNPPGFDAKEFLSVGDARVRIGWLDALRGQARLRGIEASDIGLWLERAADGRENWALVPPRDPAAARTEFDLGYIKLSRMALRYHDLRAATQRAIDLDELEGSAGSDQPLRLALRGQLPGQHPYRLRVNGGPLQQLQGGAQPWPFSLDFKAAGARLHTEGEFDAGQGEARLRFDADADDLAQAGRLLGVGLPQAGAAALTGAVVAKADVIALSQLQGRLGESEFSGQLVLGFGGARARLSGDLSVAVLDSSPWLAAEGHTPGEAPRDGTPAWQAVALRDIVPLDLDLKLNVDRWLGLPVRLRDTKLSVQADARGVRAPMSATVAGAPLSGRVHLDTAAPMPTFALELAAQDLPLGVLAQELAGAGGIEGAVRSVGLRIAGRGQTLGELARELELSLDATAAQASLARADGARPFAVSLDKLQLAAGRDRRLLGSARGMLMGERARLSIRGGSLHELLREPDTPFELELALAAATLRLQTALGRAEATDETAWRFDVQAPRSGELSRWLPVNPQSQLPLVLRGRLRGTTEAWQLDQATLALGRSRLGVDARRTLVAGRPFTAATVRSTLIDAAELATLSADAGTRAGGSARLDAPILGSAVDLGDADLELDLQRVQFGGTELVDVGFVARSREGRLLPSPARGKLAGAAFTALVELDLGGESPFAKLDLSTGDIDIGALLRGLGLAEDIEGRAERLQLTLRGRGNSLRELAAGTALDAKLAGGRLTVLGAGQRPVTEIRVREAVIEADAGQPVRMRLDGTLDQSAVRIQLSTGSLADFAGDARRLPFSMVAQAAGTRLGLDGQVMLPLGSAGRLAFEMSGERLDSLSELARVELPAWGPWSLRGPMRMSSTGYEIQGLLVNVGRSRLSGSGTLDISGPRPRLQMQVSAPTLQLDDFPMPQRLADPPESPRQEDGLRGASTRLAGRVDRLLSARFLRRFDATVDVHAGEVLSGADRLADGAVHLKLKDGRLDLDPVVLNLPGGGMRLSIAYDLKESEVDFQVAASVKRFDYGIIARRLNRADDIRGLFSLNLELAGQAPSLDSIMRNANGTLDFAVWPTELRSGVFNLWSANLVLTLLPLIDPGQKSQVNCIVGRFDLKDGDLSDDKILIDTSRVRIRGAGHANLKTEELAFVFRPRAKGPGLFRLQTPLRVSGTLTDQRFGFDPRDVFFSTLRMIASPILVPIEWFTLGPQPRDGADVCTDPLRTGAQ